MVGDALAIGALCPMAGCPECKPTHYPATYRWDVREGFGEEPTIFGPGWKEDSNPANTQPSPQG